MPLRIGLAIGILSLLVAAGCGSSSSSSSTTTSSKASSSTKSAVAVDLGTTKAGKVLVGPSGRTLYLFEKDSGSTSKCAGECATDWPPLTTSGKPSAGTGVTGNMLGTTMRSDGKEQVTYNGHPLYYFEGDKKSGTIAGQGVDCVRRRVVRGRDQRVQGREGRELVQERLLVQQRQLGRRLLLERRLGRQQLLAA